MSLRVCCACPCLCDDIEVEVTSVPLRAETLRCERGRAWFASLPGPGAPLWSLDGDRVSADLGIETFADWLATARAPLLWLGPSLTNEAIEAAISLAALAGATVSRSDGAPGEADGLDEDRAGLDAPQSAATWGEVRSSADSVLLLDVDLERDAPRFAERYLPPDTLTNGRLLRLGLDAPTDDRSTRSIPRVGDDVSSWLAFVLALRRDLERDSINAPIGGSPEIPDGSTLDVALRTIRASRHVHVLLGGTARHRAVRDQLETLATRERGSRRMTFTTLGSGGNARGVTDAATWTVGRPSPFLLTSEGTTRPLAGAIETAETVRENLFDLVIACGLEAPGEELDPAAAEALATSAARKIVLGAARADHADLAVIGAGLDPRADGTVLRSDGALLRLAGDSRDGQVDAIASILERLGELVRDRAAVSRSEGGGLER